MCFEGERTSLTSSRSNSSNEKKEGAEHAGKGQEAKKDSNPKRKAHIVDPMGEIPEVGGSQQDQRVPPVNPPPPNNAPKEREHAQKAKVQH